MDEKSRSEKTYERCPGLFACVAPSFGGDAFFDFSFLLQLCPLILLSLFSLTIPDSANNNFFFSCSDGSTRLALVFVVNKIVDSQP